MKNTLQILAMAFCLAMTSCKKDKAITTAVVAKHVITFTGIGSGYRTIISLQIKGQDSITILSSVDNVGVVNNFKTIINNGDHLKIAFIPNNPTAAYFYKLDDNDQQVDNDYVNLAQGTSLTITYPKVSN